MPKTSYACTGCAPIDKSILDTYIALLSTNKSAQNAEAARVGAEAQRVIAEDARVVAESQRDAAYAVAEGTESGSVAGDGSRWGAFKSAEAERDEALSEYVSLLMAPWVVAGDVAENVFAPDDEEDTPQEAKRRWDLGQRTYLSVASGRTEEIIGVDDDYLYTLTWKWSLGE